MKFFVDVVEVAVGDVGVDLGGADVGVTEECLDRAQVGAITKQVGGEAVADHVGSDSFRDAGFDGIFLHNPLHRAFGQSDIFFGQVGPTIFGKLDEHGFVQIVAFGQIILQGAFGCF